MKPPGAPPGRPVTTLSGSDVGMPSRQFSRFLKARVGNPNLTPERFRLSESLQDIFKNVVPSKQVQQRAATKLTRDIARGKVRNAQDLVSWIDDNIPGPKRVTPTRAPGDKPGAEALFEAAERAFQARKAQVASSAINELKETIKRLTKLGKSSLTEQQKLLAQTRVKPPSAFPSSVQAWLNPVTSRLTAAELTTLVKSWTAKAPSKTAALARNSGQLLPAFTVTPEPMVDALKGLSPAQRASVVEQAKTLVNEGVAAEAFTETQEQTLLQAINAVQTATQTVTKTATQVKAAQAVKVVTKPPVTKVSKIKPSPVKTIGVKAPPKIARPVPVLPKPPILPRFNAKEDNLRRRAIQKAKGAIAWRQGELHGRDRWDVVVNPYTRDEDYTIVLGRKPVGAVLVKGPGSAFKTARLIFGQQINKPVIVNQPGLFATKLSPIGDRGIRLRFERDVELTKKIGSLEEKGRVFPLP